MVLEKDASAFAKGIDALGEFVSKGGLAMYTDWSMNNDYAALFGVKWTGNHDMKQVKVMPPLDTDIKDPVDLQDPGYREFWSMGLAALEESTVVATFDKDEGAIVIGMKGQTIVNGFLTDTLVNGGQGVQLFQNEINQLLPVPLPGTAVLIGSGLLGLAGLRRKWR